MIKIENSSNIEAVDFNESTNVMLIEFKGGAQYEYLDVPIECYDTIVLMDGEKDKSVGKFINEAVKGVYKFRQVVNKQVLEKALKNIHKFKLNAYCAPASNPIDRSNYEDGFENCYKYIMDSLVEKFGLEV